MTIAELIATHIATAKKALVLDWTSSLSLPPFDEPDVDREFDPHSCYDFVAVVASEQLAEPDSSRLWLIEQLAESVSRDAGIWLIVQSATSSKLPASEERWSRHLIATAFRAGLTVLGDRHLAVDGSTRAFECRRGSYPIRTYRKGDERHILALFAKSFHQPREPDHWRWKYERNPWLNHQLSLAWNRDHELLAHYAGYGVPLWDDGFESLAMHMGDTMTERSARSVGRRDNSLLARTVRHFFAEFREPEIDLFFGFNTGPIQRFCRWFIGGGQVDEVSYWRSEVPRAESRSFWLQVEADPELGSDFDRLFSSAAKDYGFLVRRKSRYLDWRYRQCPDHEYTFLGVRRFGRLIGWSVFEQFEDRLVWGDALFLRRHARAAAAAVLATAVRLSGCRTVEAWFSPHPQWWSSLLPSLGFERLPEPQSLAMMALDNTRHLDLTALYYTKGDSDLF